MASLFNNLKNWFRKQKKDAAEKEGNLPWQADAVRDGEFAIEDAEKQEADFRASVVKVMAANKLRIKQKAEADRQATKYDATAKTIAARIKAGDGTPKTREELNTVAAEVAKYRALAAELQTQIEAAEKQEVELRASAEAVANKIARAKMNFTVLAARKQNADMRKNLVAAQAKITTMGTKGLSALDDLEKATLQSEAEADATEDMAGKDVESIAEKYAGTTTGVSLADEYLK